MPAWLSKRIQDMPSNPKAQAPRYVAITSYLGKKVYYISATCCDIPSELYDEGGTLMCYPDGGFAGGDGRCPEFTLPSQPPPKRIWQQKPKAVRNSAPASVPE